MNLRQLVKFLLWRDTTCHGEFRTMATLTGSGCPHTVVDVGANDGFYGSNSYPFVARGWRALLIEPHPKAFASLAARHSGKPNVACLNVACGATPAQLPLWIGDDGDTTQATFDPDAHPHFQDGCCRRKTVVPVHRLDALLAEHALPHDFGVLSIDTEGWDYEVLLGLDLTAWRPRLVVTEDGTRETADQKATHLRAHGYEFRQQIGPNAFWLAAASGVHRVST
jgi:FkbM family methyltransferase